MSARAIALAVVLAVSAAPTAGFAQNEAAQSPVLTVDPERMFAESAFGIAAVARLEAAQATLLAENKELESALEAEERALTDRRPTLPPEEFRRLADAFNLKAEEIRAARLAKSRSLTTLRDDDRQKFLTAIVPVLGDLMGEMGALVILDKKTVFLSFERVDVTDRAIDRIDELLGADLVQKPAPAP